MKSRGLAWLRACRLHPGRFCFCGRTHGALPARTILTHFREITLPTTIFKQNGGTTPAICVPRTGIASGTNLRFSVKAQHLKNVADVPQTWRPDQMYLAHFALSDLDGREFFHTKRLNRAGPGLAGADEKEGHYWNGNWDVRWTNDRSAAQQLQAVSEAGTLRLHLIPTKPAVVHGRNGLSVKGPLPGEASQYISFTRIESSGTMDWKGKHYALVGSSWMDHEFFSEPSDNQLTGWDWFAVQLDTGQELMLYRLRRKDGTSQQYSSGTYIDEKGAARFLKGSDFTSDAARIVEERCFGRTIPGALANLCSFAATRVDGTDPASESGTLQQGSDLAHLLGRSSGVRGADGIAKSVGSWLPGDDGIRGRYPTLGKLIRQAPFPLLPLAVAPALS